MARVGRLAEHKLELLVVGILTMAASGLAFAGARPDVPMTPPLLEPAVAVGIRVDTVLVGGYARGSFTEAMHVLASGVGRDERELVGQHLDKIFAGVLQADGLGSAGRLRVAFERTLRPDGSVRAVRVLAAEAAVGGELHTAFYFEHEGRPGYYDPFGRSLEPQPWAGPLEHLRVSSPYGLRRMHPILGRVLPHTGVDYVAPRGTPVHATADGIVAVAGERGGYGQMVEIRHPNGYSTRYAHLSRLPAGLRIGTPVSQGDVIGYVGMTGLATGPHLHYELRRGGRPIDPARLSLDAALSRSLAGGSSWAAERARLYRLLARTPTLLRVASTSR
ncbi:MAG TPA: M23 family metallopeptidase [Longimicrobiaceae bacterium]